jgi:hypothetical protein
MEQQHAPNAKVEAIVSAARTNLANEKHSKQNFLSQATQQNKGTEKMGYIPILIMLTTGMILQLSGNSFCISAGILICVSLCTLICISGFLSAIFSNEEAFSSPIPLEYSTVIGNVCDEAQIKPNN